MLDGACLTFRQYVFLLWPQVFLTLERRWQAGSPPDQLARTRNWNSLQIQIWFITHKIHIFTYICHKIQSDVGKYVYIYIYIWKSYMDPLGYGKCQNLRHSELQLSCVLFQDLNTCIIRQVFFFLKKNIWWNYSDLTRPGPPKKVAFWKGNGTPSFRKI